MTRLLFTAAMIFAALAPSPPPAQYDPTDLARVLSERIATLRAEGKFNDAAALAEELLTTIENNPDSRPDEITDASWLLRTLQTIAALPDSARARMIEVDSWKKTYRELASQRAYDAAADIAWRAVRVERDVLGNDHPQTVRSIVALARANQGRGHDEAADALYRTALDAARGTLGSLHPDVSSTLEDYAEFRRQLGRLAIADSLCRLALETNLEIFGGSGDVVASTLVRLGQIKSDLEEFETAEACIRRAMAIEREASVDGVPTLETTRQLAALQQEIGDAPGAVATYDELLSQLEKRLGDGHLQVAMARADMARALARVGENERADTTLEEAIVMYREHVGNSHDLVADALCDLTSVRIAAGRAEAAEELIEEAVRIRSASAASTKTIDAGLARALSLNGLCLLRMGRYDEAEGTLRRAARAYRALLGAGYPPYASVVSWLGEALAAQGYDDEAGPFLRAACDAADLARFRHAPESDGPEPYLPLAAVELRMGHGEEAWLAVERHYFDGWTHRTYRGLTAGQIEEEVRLERRLRRLESAITTHPADSSIAPNLDSLRSGLGEAQEAWRTLHRKRVEQDRLTCAAVADLATVQATMDEGSVVIGWLALPDTQYAYLIPSRGAVVWRGTPSLEPEVLDALRGSIRSMDSGAVDIKELGRKVFGARLAPIQDRLREALTVCVVPSGDMAGVPVEALYLDDYTAVIDLWNVVYAPSASVLAACNRSARGNTPTTLIAVGDPPFNDDHWVKMVTGETAVEPDTIVVDEWIRICRGTTSGHRDDIAALPRLAGARDDVEAITALFPESTVLLGRDASDVEIASLSAEDELARAGFVHLGTHAIADGWVAGRSSVVLSQVDAPDPWSAIVEGTPVHDGRITADDIMRELHFDGGTVVLPACDTSAAAKTRQDTYLDLACAMLCAGAGAIVTSQWRIPARPTSILTLRFYENILKRQMTTPAALRDARLWLHNFADATGHRPYAHPYYWSGFVCVGAGS